MARKNALRPANDCTRERLGAKSQVNIWYCVESVLLVHRGLTDKLMQAPNMIGDSGLHRRSHPDGAVYPAEVVPRHEQRHGCPEIGKRLADGVCLASKPAKVHPNSEVSPFDVGCGDAGKIRVAGSQLRDCRYDLAAAVPFWACLQAPIDLLQLREVDVRAVPFLDCSHVAAQASVVIWNLPTVR